MRWAFWRRRRVQSPPASAVPDDHARTPDAGPREEHPDQSRPRAPAFSGAQPGTPALVPGRLAGPRPGPVLVPRLQAALVGVVRAVLDRDRATLQRLLDRLDAPSKGAGPSDAAPAAAAALDALGPRVLAAADVTLAEAGAGGVAAAAALAQGETLLTRAERLRREMAPHCPPDLLRATVRSALGTGAELPVERSDRDLLLAAAVLLAQGMADGSGGPDDLAAELAALPPGTRG